MRQAQVGPLSDGEQMMPGRGGRYWVPAMWSSVARGFRSDEDLKAIIATGPHAVLRVKADIDPPVLRVQTDGSWISRISDPAASRRLRRKGARGKDIPGVEVRVEDRSVPRLEVQFGQLAASWCGRDVRWGCCGRGWPEPPRSNRPPPVKRRAGRSLPARRPAAHRLGLPNPPTGHGAGSGSGRSTPLPPPST